MEEVTKARKWLESFQKSSNSLHQKHVRDAVNEHKAGENFALSGLKIAEIEPGFIACKFSVPNWLLDRDGNWHAGAIATLIDNVGAAAIASETGQIKVSVDFDISYLSTAQINEELVIEARVLCNKGKLSSVIVEIRKRKSGEVVALGKQWMASINLGISKL